MFERGLDQLSERTGLRMVVKRTASPGENRRGPSRPYAVTVEAIDRFNRVVHVGSRRLNYGHLVLATGSRPRRVGSELGGDIEGGCDIRPAQGEGNCLLQQA